ncbi:MAG: hypothetical protein Q9184_000329 [Pyrenodesmia sp. 2 TL-2023]
MPTKPGGGPRKGQAAKKLQIEKMIDTAKKTQSTSTARHSTAAKPAATKADYTYAHKPGNGPNIVQMAKYGVNGTISKQPVKGISTKTVTVRLPCQGSVAIQKKLPISFTQPARVTAALPKAFKNPNHVVVRLPPKESIKEPVTFETLPSEIRNAIYDLAMPRCKYGIKTIQHSKELTYYLPLSKTISGPQLKAADAQRRRLFDLPKRQHIDQAIPPYKLSPGPAALLLVSKKVNADTTAILYGRNIFAFQAIGPLRKFLDALRPATRSLVRSLEIFHKTAGDPKDFSHQKWKNLHDLSWEKLCFQIRDQCTGLATLSLDLTVHDVPFELGPEANWMGPLYAFMNLGHLQEIHFRLHQTFTERAVLLVEQYEIRKELMGANFHEPTTPAEDVFVIEKPKMKARPALQSLRITGNMATQPTKSFSRLPASRYAGMTIEQCMDLPTHLLPNQQPSLGPRATIFWSPPTPTEVEDHPLYHKKGSPGEKEAIRKMNLKHKKERLEKKELEQAKKTKKLKGKA